MSDPRFLPHGDHRPDVPPDVFVADTARLIGQVKLGAGASVWYGAVLRGDINPIEIGEGSNIQDASVLHVTYEEPCRVGREVVVGHAVNLHGCTVGDGALIGIGSTVLTGARIGSGSIVAAGAVVPEGTNVMPGTLVAGVPARPRRQVTEEEQAEIRRLAAKYVRVAVEARESLADRAVGGTGSQGGGGR